MRIPDWPTDVAFLDRTDRGVLLHLHVVPGAARTEVAGLHGDRLKVRVKAPPAEGAANRELLRFLAGVFDVPAGAIEIVRGASDRRKTVRLPPDTVLTPGHAALAERRR